MSDSTSRGRDAVAVADRVEAAGAEGYFRSIVENTSDAVVGVDESGNVVVANPAVERLFGYVPEELLGEPVTTLMPERLRSAHDTAFERYLSSGERTVDWNYVEFPGEHRDGHELQLSIAFRETDSAGERMFTGFIRDITDRKERERELERRRDELERLNRINGVIRDINRSLVEASDRDAMLMAVCEHLTAADQYRFAWIGERDLSSERVRPTAWAGNGTGYLDGAVVPADRGDEAVSPATAAARTGEPQIMSNVAEDPAFEPWRADALDQENRSVAAVPIAYDDTLYGVLVVYGERLGLFDERERAVLTELGESIGHAVNALEQRRMIMGDTRLEVELRASDAIDECNVLDSGETLTVNRSVPGTGDTVVLFVSTDADVESGFVADVFGELAPVEGVRRVSDRLLEVVMVDPPVARTLSAHGGRIKSASVEGMDLHFVTEVPQDADVRAVVESIRETFPGTELIAQRTVSRDDRSVEEYRATADAELTEKQRTTLEAAYFGGYFDRPRESTGEELAASLGVSPSTFHQHLQTGLRKSLATLFN